MRIPTRQKAATTNGSHLSAEAGFWIRFRRETSEGETLDYSHARRELQRLLITAFTGRELWLFAQTGAGGAELVALISAPTAPPALLAAELIGALERLGALDLAFFDRLAWERPKHEALIRQIQAGLLSGRAAEVDQGVGLRQVAAAALRQAAEQGIPDSRARYALIWTLCQAIPEPERICTVGGVEVPHGPPDALWDRVLTEMDVEGAEALRELAVCMEATG